MSVPDIVQERLVDEEVGGQLPLGGEDRLLVTRTRTLVYRGEGLLSAESVEEFPHGAERVAVAEGRRKSKILLDYGIDGAKELSVPTDRLMDALRAVFAGVLFAADVITPGESVERLYRRGELTFAITSNRVIKHVGADIWNVEEFEEFHFDDITGIDVEPGSVSSELILEVDGRPERIKTPSDDVREIRVNVERALVAFHDLDSFEEFAQTVAGEPEPAGSEAVVEAETGGTESAPGDGPDGGSRADESPTDPRSVFDSELDLLGATSESVSSAGGSDEGGSTGRAAGAPTDSTGSGAEFEDAGFEPVAGGDEETAAAVEELRRAIEHQTELIEEQQRTIERLIEELRSR